VVGFCSIKHVITKQPYIPQLIRYFEQAGLILHFINGVEGHVAVQDWMTTAYENPKGNCNVEIASCPVWQSKWMPLSLQLAFLW